MIPVFATIAFRLPTFNRSTMNLKSFCAPVAFLAFVACATPKPVDNSGAVIPASPSASTSGTVRWSGNLQPMQQQTGGLGPTGQNKTFGTVTLTSIGTDRTAFRISLSTSLQNSASLNWSVLPGQCGSGTMSLVPVERFPVIEVSTNGRGDLSSEMALTLPTSGTYHLNVYWPGGGQQLNDVMTCANLHR